MRQMPFIPPQMMDPERLSAAGLGSQAELVARLFGTNALFAQQRPIDATVSTPHFDQNTEGGALSLQAHTTSLSNQAHPGYQSAGQPAERQPSRQREGSTGFLSGIQNFLDGGRGQKVNQTVQWLQQQGLDEGTARGLAANPPLLQHYLKQFVDASDPESQLRREKLGHEVQDLREGRGAIPQNEQYLIDNGYDPQAARTIARNPSALTNALKDIREGRNAPRPMSAEERVQWGIPQDDQRPYSMTAEGPKLIGGNGVTVDARNMGNIPPGYRVEYDQQGNPIQMVPIPGGPAAMEAAEAERIRSDREGQGQRYGRIVLEDIGRVLESVESNPNLVAGPLGSMLSKLPGTGAHDVSSMLNTIRANVGFDRLQAMRATSPTGGALGAVSDSENKMLQSTLGALEQSQSPQQFAQNLRRLQNLYTEIVHGPAPSGVSDDEWSAKAWRSTPQDSSPPRQIMDVEDYKRLPSGTQFLAPDGTVRRKP